MDSPSAPSWNARLLSDEWAVLQKEVNGVEDVPYSVDAEAPDRPDMTWLFPKTTCLDTKIHKAYGWKGTNEDTCR